MTSCTIHWVLATCPSACIHRSTCSSSQQCSIHSITGMFGCRYKCSADYDSICLLLFLQPLDGAIAKPVAREHGKDSRCDCRNVWIVAVPLKKRGITSTGTNSHSISLRVWLTSPGAVVLIWTEHPHVWEAWHSKTSLWYVWFGLQTVTASYASLQVMPGGLPEL